MAKTAYDAAGDTIRPTADAMSKSTTSGLERLRNSSSELGTSFQRSLAQMFEKQPLLLGAVGIAVGAAIAASLPASNVENRLKHDLAFLNREGIPGWLRI